ncbi:NTP transferase domain-containing protein [uncultured Thalassospira sp.]|uniref:molybdenum cofactor guanylyltransferase n=1 Tax=uncultured Thalassospira sp. TaxID=404382 RepID=UPI0030D6FBBC|tara:strand:- start:9791 stop:10468 length:678 start_codon:yes stop_codon:yes gene_type:complete
MAPTVHCPDKNRVSLPPITALVLAGGAGTRMGGGKPFRKLHGTYLIEHALANARRNCNAVMIASNENKADYAAYDCPVIGDVPAPGRGPMAGILAGLQHLGNDSDWMAVFAVDCPFLPNDLVSSLYQAMIAPLATPADQTQNPIRAAYAHYAGRDHFLASLWHRDMAPAIATLLDQDQRRVRAALQQANAVKVDFTTRENDADTARLFANINTQSDIDQLETLPI